MKFYVITEIETAIHLKPSQPIELLYYAVGIALVGLALWLTNMAFTKPQKDTSTLEKPEV